MIKGNAWTPQRFWLVTQVDSQKDPERYIELIRAGYNEEGTSKKERNMTEKEILKILETLEHPKYKRATVDTYLIWDLICNNCGAEHRIGTGDTELDPCCQAPDF